MATILDQIRTAVIKSGISRYRISSEVGIDQPQLSRLMTGQAGLSIESLERLADYLGLKIVLKPKRKKKGR